MNNDETKTVSFDVMLTTLHDAYRGSFDAFLSALAETQDPLEVIALHAEFVEYVAGINAEVSSSIVESCVFTGPSQEYH